MSAKEDVTARADAAGTPAATEHNDGLAYVQGKLRDGEVCIKITTEDGVYAVTGPAETAREVKELLEQEPGVHAEILDEPVEAHPAYLSNTLHAGCLVQFKRGWPEKIQRAIGTYHHGLDRLQPSHPYIDRLEALAPGAPPNNRAARRGSNHKGKGRNRRGKKRRR
jgi:hypothetical protein